MMPRMRGGRKTGMTILRLGAAAIGIALAALAGAADANTYDVNCNSGMVSGAASESFSATTVLGAVLGTPGSLPSVSPAPANGDVIEITGICVEDVTVTTSGLTITNHSGAGTGLSATDGVEGQFEIAGATGIVIDGIVLGSSGAFSFASANDLALLYAHDGAAVTVTDGTEITNSPLLGALAARSSKLQLMSTTNTGGGTTVSLNGGGGGDQFARDNGGLQARDNGAIVIGNSDGTGIVSITDHAFDAVSAYRNGSLVIYAANFTGNTAHQITVMSASSAHMSLAEVSITAPTGAPNAIQVVGTSTVQIDTGVTVAGASGAEAISVVGGSALLLQGAKIATPGAGPVIEASSGSVIALAGGNTICSGTLSGTTCTAASGIALQIDRVASLVQISGADFGFAAASDTVTGSGSAELQSTVDLGLGLVSSSPSLTWTTESSGITVHQNSSFRLQGGATITGTLTVSQSSNAFFNKSMGSAANAVSSILCPFGIVPAAHVAASGGSITPAPVLSTTFLSTAPNQCLSF
jgi:hypothetical protein